MVELSFIPEDEARTILEAEVTTHTSKGYVKEPKGFVNHLIDTGRIGYEVTNSILAKHPSLRGLINPDVIRVEGYMHDFGKAAEGSNYHEVSTAHHILTHGEEMGLVRGGTKSEREKLVREISAIVPPDYALFETLGGNDFPKSAVYPEVTNFVGRVEELRRRLSSTTTPLSMEEFALPYTLAQQVALFADLTNVGGKRVSVSERVNEIEARYSDETGKFYDPIYASLTRQIRPRILVVGKTIEGLLK